ncbi:hypothetical protein, partial [Deinococcus misasensis]|uniref:hypothetical protein n=1 Tax=Deinococcus misasensis TaxID=392413 RepID=UPI000556FBBD
WEVVEQVRCSVVLTERMGGKEAFDASELGRVLSLSGETVSNTLLDDMFSLQEGLEHLTEGMEVIFSIGKVFPEGSS